MKFSNHLNQEEILNEIQSKFGHIMLKSQIEREFSLTEKENNFLDFDSDMNQKKNDNNEDVMKIKKVLRVIFDEIDVKLTKFFIKFQKEEEKNVELLNRLITEKQKQGIVNSNNHNQILNHQLRTMDVRNDLLQEFIKRKLQKGKKLDQQMKLRDIYLNQLKQGIARKEKELKMARETFKKTVLGITDKQLQKCKSKVTSSNKTESS